MHNIPIFDTGKTGSYDRRNEGWTFACGFAGMIIAVFAVVMIAAGIFDPSAPASVLLAGLGMMGFVLTFAMMFLTHRNFNLSTPAVRVMDAIYSLPKEDRKKYKISRAEVNALGSHEANLIVSEIDSYRRSRTTNSGLNRMLGDITEYNKVVKDMEV